MLMFMLGALGAASLASIRAQAAKLLREFRPPAHERRGSPTKLGTVLSQANAGRQHGYFAFLEARASATLTLLGAVRTCVDAGLVFFTSHLGLQWKING
jgi:hypothetical protein